MNLLIFILVKQKNKKGAKQKYLFEIEMGIEVCKRSKHKIMHYSVQPAAKCMYKM